MTSHPTDRYPNGDQLREHERHLDQGDDTTLDNHENHAENTSLVGPVPTDPAVQVSRHTPRAKTGWSGWLLRLVIAVLSVATVHDLAVAAMGAPGGAVAPRGCQVCTLVGAR